MLVVIKPDQASGSHGVKIIDSLSSQIDWFSSPQPGDIVTQEFVEGPSCFVEVLGRPGSYHAFQVVDLGVDREWDCNKVSTPSGLSKNKIKRL